MFRTHWFKRTELKLIYTLKIHPNLFYIYTSTSDIQRLFSKNMIKFRDKWEIPIEFNIFNYLVINIFFEKVTIALWADKVIK